MTVLGVGVAAAAALIAWRVEPPRRHNGRQPPLVEARVIREETVAEWYTAYGGVAAIHRANLAAEVAAVVVERVDDIRTGSHVAADQILLLLDDREYRIALERAQAEAAAQQAERDELDADAKSLERLMGTAERELKVARDEKARLADLFERGLAAKKEYDFANLAFQQADRVLQGYQREAATLGPRRKKLEAAYRASVTDATLARLNIERCTVRAPFSGRVESLPVDRGDRVAPGTILLTLLDTSSVEVSLRLPASLNGQVKVGAPCRLESESRKEFVWSANVARISAAADSQTRTFTVYVEVDNHDKPHPLMPGTFVTAHVQGPVHSKAIVLPRSACRNGRVFVVESEKGDPDGPTLARLRPVVTGRTIEERVLVEDGLRGGEKVILTRVDQLADGSPIRVRLTSPMAADAGTSSRHHKAALPAQSGPVSGASNRP